MKAFLTICSILFCLCGCTSDSDNLEEEYCNVKLVIYPKEVPSDFYVQYKFDQYYGENYEFDSKDKNVKKLVTFEGDYANAKVTLSESERNEIWRMMREINVLKYPQNYEPHAAGTMSHEPIFNFKFGFHGLTKEISWEKSTTMYSCPEADQLKNLMMTLDSIIVNKEEYRNLKKKEEF
jgi:hypothetical protein